MATAGQPHPSAREALGRAVVVGTGISNRLSAVERRLFDHGEGGLADE